MSWSQSLIKLSTYEVETLQKRLGEIVDRRMAAQQRLARLLHEGAEEVAYAANDIESGLRITAYLQGLRLKKTAIEAEIRAIEAEEVGARDALSEAFEAQKKYEQVAENERVAERKEAGRRETAALDELGLRKVAR